VFKLLGKAGIDMAQMPAASVSIPHTLGYFMHSGGHGNIPSDGNVSTSSWKRIFNENLAKDET
jgi:hypothetical protein